MVVLVQVEIFVLAKKMAKKSIGGPIGCHSYGSQPNTPTTCPDGPNNIHLAQLLDVLLGAPM
jgi:hypothetical protein